MLGLKGRGKTTLRKRKKNETTEITLHINTYFAIIYPVQKEKPNLKIGFDFGMTNSTISFYDAESNGLINFTPDPAANGYIPTIVSYNKNKPDEVLIGNAAKTKLTAKSFDTYENFKLRLGKRFNEVIEGKNKTPNEVAHDFINKFLALFKESHNEIQNIVMTVPATWIREQSNQTARENIENIFTSLGYGEEKFCLESEPIAAAAYFCHAYKIKNDKNTNHGENGYNGFITVIDYGGGTLDVTLCEVTNGMSIKVLEQHGFGEDNQTNGRAGVAFDEAVIEKLIADNNLAIEKGSRSFINLRNSFEEQKRLQCPKITEQLKYYFVKPAILEGEVLFSLIYNNDGDEVDVHCEDLVYCFNKINAPVLNESLVKIQQFYDTYDGIDSSSQNNFRVLLVGGFSNFYAVEAKVREFFNSPVGSKDKRFEQPFSLINRSFAISRGAALIARDMIIPEYTCPYNIGYIVVERDIMDQWTDRDVLVIKKGTKIADIKSAVFPPGRCVKVQHESGKLRIFMDDGRSNNEGRLQAAVDKSVIELFPNIENTDNEYKVGFSVNKNLIPTIHISDKYGNVTHTSLSKLLERIGIMQK